jgi:hypothetical protein
MSKHFEITDATLIRKFNELAKKAVSHSLNRRNNEPFPHMPLVDVPELHACDAYNPKAKTTLSEQFFVGFDDNNKGEHVVLYREKDIHEHTLIKIINGHDDVEKIVCDASLNVLRVSGWNDKQAVEAFITSVHTSYFDEGAVSLGACVKAVPPQPSGLVRS